jgi:hypothetical protein
MTSSSRGDARAAVPVRRAGLVLGALALLGAGCREPPTVDTKAQILRMMRSCNGSDGNESQTMNMDTYVVMIYDVVHRDDVPANATRADCQACIADPSKCLFEPPVCTCGGPISATPPNFADQVAGTRTPSLDSVDLYCLQVLAVEKGTLLQRSPAPCDCDTTWWTPTFLNQSARLCAMSAPNAVGPHPIELDVVCPGDQRNNFGNNFQSFSDCIGTPPQM